MEEWFREAIMAQADIFGIDLDTACFEEFPPVTCDDWPTHISCTHESLESDEPVSDVPLVYYKLRKPDGKMRQALVGQCSVCHTVHAGWLARVVQVSVRAQPCCKEVQSECDRVVVCR